MKIIPLFLLSLATLLFTACDDKDEVVLESGTYVGNFNRYSPGSNSESTKVTITIAESTFTGMSEIMKCPAIGTGSFKITGTDIEFSNQSPWTAEFDWSYILGGKYRIKVFQEEVIMVRMYDNQTTDVYTLKKQIQQTPKFTY